MTIPSLDLAVQPSIVQIPPSPIPAVSPAIERLGLREAFPLVVDLTRELFGDAFDVSVEADPEIHDWFDVVFTVRTRDSAEGVREKNSQWHRRLPHGTAGAGGAFCLSIDLEP